MSSSFLLVAPYIRVLFRSGRLLKRSILPRIRSHALIPCCQEIRGVHYTICYISSFSKISLSRPSSRNPDPLGAEPRSRSERDCKDTKIILTPAILRGKFLSSSTQPKPISRRLARPLPSFAFAKVSLLFHSSQIYFLPSRVNNCCITTNQQLTKEIFLQQRGCRAIFEGFYFFTKRTATILAVAVFTSPAHSSISKTALRSVTSRGRATTFSAQFIGVGRR